jgi:valyl-tRNA synthetase
VIQQVIAQVRNTRNSNQLSPKEALPLAIKTTSGINYMAYEGIIKQLGNINELSTVNDATAGANSFIAGTDEFFIKLEIEIDIAAEKERLTKEKEYLEGFLSVLWQMPNPRL